MKTVIIGLGNALASDDAVGMEVARALAIRKLPPSTRVAEGATAGVGLIDLLLDAERAILVDAVSSDASPGTVLRLTERDLPDADLRPLSAHDLALPEALALGRALHPERMPREIVVFGVEAERLDPYRESLSPAVRAAIPAVVEAILAELEHSA